MKDPEHSSGPAVLNNTFFELLLPRYMLRDLKKNHPSSFPAQIAIYILLQRRNIIWRRLMNTAFLSQRSSVCCNLRCSISRSDRDATYTSLTGRGRYGTDLLLVLCRISLPLSSSLFFGKYVSGRNGKLVQISFFFFFCIS